MEVLAKAKRTNRLGGLFFTQSDEARGNYRTYELGLIYLLTHDCSPLFSALGRLSRGVVVHPQHPRHEGVAHHQRDAAEQERALRPLHRLGPLLPGLSRTFHRWRTSDLRRFKPGQFL